MRARTSDNHLGDSFSVAGACVLEKRHCGGRGTLLGAGIGTFARGVGILDAGFEGRKSAARVVKGLMGTETGIEPGKANCEDVYEARLGSQLWWSIARYLGRRS